MQRRCLETDMGVDQLYANGRIAVMSTRLLTADKFARIAESNTLAEAVKAVAENGYGNGVTLTVPNDYEQLLVAELDEALKVFKELCGNRHAVNYFLAKYDYLNAKVLMKCKYMRIDGLAYCYNQATVPAAAMQTAFVNDDYSAVSKNMAEACDKIDAEYADGNRSPSIVDVTLDKAMYADMLLHANKCKMRFRFIKDMFVYQADTVNLMSAYRAHKAGLDKVAYEKMLIDGGSISKETLLALFDDETKANNLDYVYKRFYALCKADNANLASAEREQKEHTYRILRDNADLMTIQPVLEYFFNKVNEIDRVRQLFVAVKAGLDKDKIKEILK